MSFERLVGGVHKSIQMKEKNFTSLDFNFIFYVLMIHTVPYDVDIWWIPQFVNNIIDSKVGIMFIIVYNVLCKSYLDSYFDTPMFQSLVYSCVQASDVCGSTCLLSYCFRILQAVALSGSRGGPFGCFAGCRLLRVTCSEVRVAH